MRNNNVRKNSNSKYHKKRHDLLTGPEDDDCDVFTDQDFDPEPLLDGDFLLVFD